jgi:hypothetical protein
MSAFKRFLDFRDLEARGGDDITYRAYDLQRTYGAASQKRALRRIGVRSLGELQDYLAQMGLRETTLGQLMRWYTYDRVITGELRKTHLKGTL